eukprot:263587_1
MGKHAQLVIGPAGSGKSTYCQSIYEHCCVQRRTVHVINLDPAAETFKYPVSIDIRDLISLDDVSEELKLGPNGGLIFCMEYLIENIQWLETKIGAYEDDYLIIDCPGQIELYTHIPVMKQLVYCFDKWHYRMCCVYLLDSVFITDTSKFASGILCCLSAMLQLELPHINVLTKVDLLEKNKSNDLSELCDPDLKLLQFKMEQESKHDNDKHKLLTSNIAQLLKTYDMVSFLPYSCHDIDSIEMILAHVDHAIQYGEDKEPIEPEKWNKNKEDQEEFFYEKQKELLEQRKEQEKEMMKYTQINKQKIESDITDID